MEAVSKNASSKAGVCCAFVKELVGVVSSGWGVVSDIFDGWPESDIFKLVIDRICIVKIHVRYNSL